MDACWYDQANDILYLIELKDWGSSTLDEEGDSTKSEEWILENKKRISEYRINTLLKKSIDCVCMFASILLARPYGSRINACYPFTISVKTQIKLLSIINWAENDTSYVSNVNTKYRSKFNPYAKLFDIKVFLVLTKNQAMEHFSWVG